MENNEGPKLTEEDFEHIWLRHKEKLFKHFAFYVGGAAVLAALGLWVWVDRVAARAVDQYVGTDAFKAEVVRRYTSQLTELNDRLEAARGEIAGVEIDAEMLASIPYSITKDGFILSDAKGGTVYLEFGFSQGSRGFIEFKSPFKEVPFVSVTKVGSMTPVDQNLVTDVSNQGIKVYAPFAGEIMWLAVGK